MPERPEPQTASAPASGLDVPLRVTLFPDHKAQSKGELATTLRALCQRIRDTRAVSKAALPWLKLAQFGDTRTDKGSLRYDANVMAITGVEGDYDGQQITMDRARRILMARRVAAVLYTSPSHRPEAPRWRILCPVSHAMPPGERTRLLERMNGLFVGALSPESWTLSQSYYYGAIHGAEHHEVITVEGRCIDTADDLDADALGKPVKAKTEAPAPTPSSPRQPYTGDGSAYGKAALERECANIRNANDGGKHHAVNKGAYSVAGLVAAGEIPEGAAWSELSAALADIRDRCDDYNAAQRTLRDGWTAGLAAPRAVPERLVALARAPFGIPEGEALPADVDPETGEVIVPAPHTHLKAPPSPLPLIYFADTAPNLDAADFIEGLLIDEAMSVIYGPSNCGKTFFATDLALHVATGRPWRGKEIEPGGVIYCALEGSHGISNRVAAFKQANNLQGCEVPFAIIPVALNLLDPDADTSRVIEAVAIASATMGIPVKWIIMDTLSRALAGGNENSPEDMGALVANGDRIRQACKAHLSWIHHSGKDQAAGARGHSLLRAATDTEIEITRPDTSAPSVATVTKQRELEIEGRFVFKLATVELGTNRRGKPVTSCVVEPLDESQAATQQIKLAPGARAALQALEEALAEAGRPSGQAAVPAGTHVVPVDLWRHRFYARSTLENQEAKKKAFQRGSKDLLAAKVAAALNDVVWLVRE